MGAATEATDRLRPGRRLMGTTQSIRRCLLVLSASVLVAAGTQAAALPEESALNFPPPLASYGDSEMTGLWSVLVHRVQQEPLNLWATLLFLGAILHTFFANKFLHWAHVLEERRKSETGGAGGGVTGAGQAGMAARVLHFLGEVEVIFGIWCVPLFVMLVIGTGWHSATDYFNHRVSYEEPVFVTVIMAIASTRPILQLAENSLRSFARLGGGGPAAWWLTILTLGPLLGSLITEPAAMTISALLLAKQFYALKPSPRLAYGTLGLLFVNISVGGVLTHFAAPPVLMVAGPWGWTTSFMLRRFGWIAILGILISNAIYYLALRRAFPASNRRSWDEGAGEKPVPPWITVAHAGFMVWCVPNAHHPALVIGGLLFFLAFHQITAEYQNAFQLRSPLLVGFFLAGLVIHGGLQQWWIEPVLSRLKQVPLVLCAATLTAFNDNAAITYLATLVPNLGYSLQYAVVAGSLAGGGLTVIANAPNPAGQAILARHFPGGIAPSGLLLGALPATVVMLVCFLCAR